MSPRQIDDSERAAIREEARLVRIIKKGIFWGLLWFVLLVILPVMLCVAVISSLP